MINDKNFNKFNKKFLFIFMIFFLIIFPTNQFSVVSKSNENEYCYGFIVPVINSENISLNNKLNNNIRNMINDLLRENISVYWIVDNVNTIVKKINNDTEFAMDFDKGSFVISFTGDNFLDLKCTAIICDYNQSNEIQENNIQVPIYLLIEPFDVDLYELSYVKIAHYKNFVLTGSEYAYVKIAEKCGFFDFDFLNERSINKLNRNNYNVIIFGYGGLELTSIGNTPLGVAYWVWEDIRFQTSRYIRDFVGNGGGYIGSCAAAYKATSGTVDFAIKLNFTKAAYNINLPSFGFLAISDTLTQQSNALLDQIESKIVNNSHPVSFGLDTIIGDWVYGGPKFVNMGKNTQEIAVFHNTREDLDGTPSWISSKFGNGKVVIFSTHPEIYELHYNKVGKTAISNSLYYTTSKNIGNVNINQSRTMLFIKDVWDNTLDLKINTNNDLNIFQDIKSNANQLTNKMKNITNTLNETYNLITEIADDKNIDLYEDHNYIFLGYFSTLEIKNKFLNNSIKYLEDMIFNLDKINNIYPYIQDNEDAIKQIEMLKSKITERINNSDKICLKLKNYCNDYKESIQKYQQSTLQELRENIVYFKLHKVTREIPELFSNNVKCFFNSTTALRNIWYNYETNLVI